MTNGTPPNTHVIRQPFNESLYVARKQELVQAQAWQAANKNRVLTVTSPPAQGKSWFLAHFYQTLVKDGAPAFFIDITKFLYPGPLGAREINHDLLQTNILQFATELRQNCPVTPPINEKSEPAAILRPLASAVSQKCWPREPIYLFVDGGDEPTKDALKAIEREVLGPVMATENWRLTIALREDQRLSYFLLKTQERLELKPPSHTETAVPYQGYEQLKRLTDNTTLTPEQIIALLPNYPWSHLGLNTFLFEEAKATLETEGVPRLREQLLERGVKDLIQADAPEDVSHLVHWLRNIESMKSNPSVEWSLEDLATFLDKPRSDAWNVLQPLLKHLLILNVSNRYKIADGLREFVREVGPLT